MRGWTPPPRVGRERNREEDYVDGCLSTWDRSWDIPNQGM